ncbi:MAG: ribosome biogenesis GTP-binding protein YihA/YsxC [Verrucomicrobia bacterium]|nr:ribosome biogenesis GTP-binding protein YihA/YsxC [Verrucomicrobiota bacterium]
MKIKSSEFLRSASNVEGCPQSPFPEFAFIGRSNVGKSSIINLLTERRELAKVSVTPGKTKLLNFFRINGNWHLVDLPGYGYARVGKEERADFNEAVADFIEQREKLRLVFVLIDSRLEPQKIDREFLGWLEGTGKPFALIFTKIDKLSSTQAQSNIARFIKAVFAGRTELPRTFATSSTTKAGRSDILKFIEEMLAERK